MAVFIPEKNTLLTIHKGASLRKTFQFPVGGALEFAAGDEAWFTLTAAADTTTEVLPSFSTSDSSPDAHVAINSVNNTLTIFIPHTVTGGVTLNGIEEGYYDLKFRPVATPEDVSILMAGPVAFVAEALRQGEPV